MRNLIAVSSRNGTLIFNRTDNGNVKPRAIIKGIGGKFRLIPSKGWIVGTGQDASGKEASARGALPTAARCLLSSC
jgi:hypothetical protein